METLRAGDAVVVVDVQRDFCPGGALPVAGGDTVIPAINEWLQAATDQQIPVIASRDWHPREHPSFRTHGGAWPSHCVQGTSGADFHPELRLPGHTVIVCKGTRLDRDQISAFDETGLAAHLRARNIRRLWITGLALDVCVRATALDARREGFDAHVLLHATRAIDAARGREAVAEMRKAGAIIHECARPFMMVDEASRESFPASDPPAFSPQGH